MLDCRLFMCDSFTATIHVARHWDSRTVEVETALYSRRRELSNAFHGVYPHSSEPLTIRTIVRSALADALNEARER